MTTASATPQQMRDRLLQAIDSHSNQIRNMVAVLEVITYLEKFPITKEALEETRLGKLINDVRKQTRDEDLAKRAKKLLRRRSASRGQNHKRRPLLQLPKAEKSSGKKRKGEQRENVPLPAKMAKLSSFKPMHNSDPPPPTNGIAGSPETRLDKQAIPSPERPRTDHLENDKHSRIPINAVKPHPSSPGIAKLPSTSSLLKTAVLQQQARLDEGGGGPYQARSPRCLSSSPRSPRNAKLEPTSKRSSTCVSKGAIQSPARSPRLPSSLLSSLPLMSPAQESHVDGPLPLAHRTVMHWPSLAQPPHSTAAPEPQAVLPPAPLTTPHNSECVESHKPSSSSVVVVRAEDEAAASSSDRKKRKKYRSRDYSVNLQGQDTEDKTKPVRLKERRLTFDPVTGQIKSSVHKEPSQVEESPRTPPPVPKPRTDLPFPQSQQQQQLPPAPSPFQQTNWKELSRNEIIQSYLNLQSNVLTSSGVQAPGAHFFMSEYLKREESDVREARRGVHVLQLDGPVTETPGLSREVTEEDLRRVHTEHWHGVNGCYDTKGTWYDWTACISLDPHGDESKLNILPYVCLD
ncbi:hypothetical protein DPEC_G00056850 [Dallia pectoralis]|uniref:Uncharacterized protein n=1 Tax=Dallia pectoralis TaxID=75939 RepID=A0ACC2H606_DALPE|nr:hypothetical protein DPEC_G00056850 [Dallia pectoralis]